MEKNVRSNFILSHRAISRISRMHKKYFVKFLKEVIRHSHFFSYTIFNYMFKRIHF